MAEMTRAQAEAIRAQLQAVSERVRGLEREFPPEALRTPPRPASWSAADNLVHLTLASRALVPRMENTLGKLEAAGRRTSGESHPDVLGRAYAWLLEPPVHLKVSAPRPFVPPAGTAAEDAVPAFLAEQEKIQALVDRAVGLDLASRKVPSPVSRYLRYNVCAVFHVLAAHQRRHLWQARRAAVAATEAKVR
jgi:hypothetical protein